MAMVQSFPSFPSLATMGYSGAASELLVAVAAPPGGSIIVDDGKKKESITILDGGMGHLLRRKGIEVKGEIGSIERFLGVAMANLEKPDLVKEAHEDYIKAGSRVITSNTYSCVPSIVGNKQRAIEAIEAAGSLARQVADKWSMPGDQVMVAGCLPPLHETYRPDRVAPQEKLQEEYALIAEHIAPFSDILLCETMSCAREAAAAVKAVAAMGKPVWVSWTLSEAPDGTLMSGESIEEAVKALDQYLKAGGPIQACLFNCSQVEAINVALPRLRQVLPPGIMTGAYANGFCTVSSPGGSNEYREDMTPSMYADRCSHWARGGSRIIGGCCGVFPEHIEAVRSSSMTAKYSS